MSRLRAPARLSPAGLLLLLGALSPTVARADVDSDGDGLSDAEETDTWGTDPYDADTDGGGLTDGEEAEDGGLDPLDGADDALPGTCAADDSVYLTGDFSSTSAPSGWSLGGTASLTAGVWDADGSGWLRLTAASSDQTGYALLDEPVDACDGVAFALRWASHSGSGAHGLAAWLIDGDVDATSFAIGNEDGSLGYVGLAGAYLGVGLDEQGDFSAVTGAGATTPDTMVLAGSEDDGWAALDVTAAGEVADWDSLRSRPVTESGDGRQLFVVLEPRLYTGYDVTVYVREGYDAVPEAILSATYKESAPDTLKLGVSATTGTRNNIHEIGDVAFAPLGGRALADLRATVRADKGTVVPGDSVTLTFTTSNAWADDATAMQSALDLDDWFDSPSWTCADQDGAPCATASGSGDVSSADDLASGDSLVWTVSTSVNPGAYGTLTVTGSAALGSGWLDLTADDAEAELSFELADYDYDADGLSNEEEGETTGTDPTLSDTDGDGATDSEEIDRCGTDPLDEDGDDDGLSDGEECLTYGTDPDDADMDDDGLSDYDEITVTRSDPRVTDTDGDGLDDATEAAAGSDPSREDTDGDGLTDPDEVLVWGTDPRVSDSDGEGLGDGDEVNTYGTDPTNVDSDGDGLDDRSELQESMTDPNDADSDDDGLDDAEELRDWETDPNDADSDDDGLDDATEIYDTRTDPLDDDSDGDSLSDGEEVSTTGTDPDDSDSDSDGLSDGAEWSTVGTDPLDDDSDDDGIEDGDEVDESLTDPMDADSDDDGLGDGEEIEETGTDPNLSDSDGDGLGDGQELTETGTDPTAADTDGDGCGDGEELAGGSDPLVQDSDGDGVDDCQELTEGEDPGVVEVGTKPSGEEGGCGCATSQGPRGALGLGLLALLALRRRARP